MMLNRKKILSYDSGLCIKDVALNWHGTKMAVSSNNVVEIWTYDHNKEWIKESSVIESDKIEIIQHLSWAHPEFGQVLCVATLNTITIWEYSSAEDAGQWSSKGTISEPRHLVINDVKFSPSYSGMGQSRALDLAYCTDSGQLKVLRCKDSHLLKDWETISELSYHKDAFTCLAWHISNNTSMIAVGTIESSAKDTRGEVRLFEYSEVKHEWVYKEVIAKTFNGKVHDVAFAPNPGRSFHTLAIASGDLQIIDFKITENRRVKLVRQDQNKVVEDQNKVEVWKLSWSTLGTTLCTTGDDGLVKLWKNNSRWQCTEAIKWNGTPA